MLARRRCQLLGPPLQVGVAQPGARVAHPPPAVLVAAPQHERSQAVGASTLPTGPAADGELLLVADLDLAPRRRTSTRLVGPVEALGHHALDALFACRLQPVLAVTLPARRQQQRRFRVDELLQQRPALPVRQLPGVVTAEVQQVEHDERGRHDPCRRLGLGRVSDPEALLQAGEAGPARLVERDDLAVEHGVGRHRRQRTELGELHRDVASGPGPDTDLAVLELHHGAHAVPLGLERPSAVLGRQLADHRGHRFDVRDRHAPSSVGPGVRDERVLSGCRPNPR